MTNIYHKRAAKYRQAILTAIKEGCDAPTKIKEYLNIRNIPSDSRIYSLNIKWLMDNNLIKKVPNFENMTLSCYVPFNQVITYSIDHNKMVLQS